MLGCKFSPVAPSIVLVNVENRATPRTNLVAKYCLSQILKDPGSILVHLSLIDEALKPRLLRQQPQLSLNALELARRESALNVEGRSHPTLKLYPCVPSRLCSVGVS